jgi:type II restriction/modification system DNA methylase subunit YeeA
MIVTPRVAKHRLFVWAPPTTLPDTRFYAIAREDDSTLGILHSRFHEAWALRIGSKHGVGNDPTYNSQTCFETFTFPDGFMLDAAPPDEVTNPKARAIANATRALMKARDQWLNPLSLVEEIPEVVPGLPPRRVPKDATAMAALKKRTLTDLYNTRGTAQGLWLDNLHAALDAAVADAYGWPSTITTADALAALFKLNEERAAPDAPPAMEEVTEPDDGEEGTPNEAEAAE